MGIQGRKNRGDSFFGMHFDFHAQIDQTGIGENCDPAMIERLITEVKPDYVQCDTKGHNGAVSYPTKLGNAAPEIKADILRMWRDVTQKHNISLFAHHSGILDTMAANRHPDWAALGADGKAPETGPFSTFKPVSVFGPYTDELLIPQILEMALDYGLDGAWIDGEYFGMIIDYSECAKKAYRDAFHTEPPMPEDDNYSSYCEFCRKGYHDYINHYITEVHKKAPGFEITSNWLYSSHVPEKPTIDVDFLSGDYSPNDSLNSARFEARFLQCQGRPWDLMAWGFSTGSQAGKLCVKEFNQLCQEAAEVIMLGGGFQIYNVQLVGTVQEWPIPMWAELAEFCRQREEWCFRSKPVHQVGILHSTLSFYNEQNRLFDCFNSPHTMELRGIMFAALDNQYPTEILMTHNVMESDSLNEYGALILPDLGMIEPELKEKLLDYARQGGSLILAGSRVTREFQPYLDVEGDSENIPDTIFVEHNRKRSFLQTKYRKVTLKSGRKLSDFVMSDKNAEEPCIAASVNDLGKGKILGIYFNMEAYFYTKTAVVRDFIGSVLAEAFDSAVTIKGTKQVEVSLMEKDGRLCVNLLNLSGNHSDANYKSFDEIPPLYDIGIEVSYHKAPTAVTIEPEHIKADYTYANGKIQLTIGKLHIHSVIVIE